MRPSVVPGSPWASLGYQDTATTAIYARLNLDPVRASVGIATDAMLAAAKVKPTQKKSEVDTSDIISRNTIPGGHHVQTGGIDLSMPQMRRQLRLHEVGHIGPAHAPIQPPTSSLASTMTGIRLWIGFICLSGVVVMMVEVSIGSLYGYGFHRSHRPANANRPSSLPYMK